MRLRRCREALGWTPEVLAERGRLSSALIRDIETGKTIPSLSVLALLADMLRVSVAELVGDCLPDRDPPLPRSLATAFGRKIRRLRTALGWTVAVLAERAGLSPNYLGAIEIGTREPSLSAIAAVAGALGVSIGELFGEHPPDDDPPPPAALACRAPARFAIPFYPLDEQLEIARWHPRRA
jgi:transcriptional regulator with XRE-family HTH domain